MAFKFVVFAAFVAVARAGVLSPVAYASHSVVAHAPAVATYAHAPVVTKTVVAEAPAAYDYGYGVSDPLTGDHKSAHESRRGDVVQGSYSLVDSDGTKRTVNYAADSVNGFNAVVSKEPLAHHVAPLAVAPVAHAVATPVVSAYSAHSVHAPVVSSYSSNHVAHSAPVAVAHSVHAPVLSAYSAHSVQVPVVSSYSTNTVAHSHVAPVVSAYSAPVVSAYAAPAVAHSYAAPTHYTSAHSYAAPAHYASAYSAAPSLVQTW